MAGREAEVLNGRRRRDIRYDQVNDAVERVLLGTDGRIDHRIMTTKWIASALVNENRVAVEIDANEGSIQASIKITNDLTEFLGADEMESLEEFMANPNGPVEHIIVDEGHPIAPIHAYRVGHSIPPFITIDLNGPRYIALLFEAVFDIPRAATLREESDDA